MYLVFEHLFDDSPADYVRQRIEAAQASGRTRVGARAAEPLEVFADRLADTRGGPELPLAQREDFYTLDRRRMAVIEAAMECALEEVAVAFPLLPGESVEEDCFSYLTEPFDEVAGGTAALRRRTDRARTVVLFPEVQIRRDGLVRVADETEISLPERPRLESAAGSFVAKLLKTGLEKMAGAAAAKVGTVVLQLVLKELFHVGDDTTKLVNRINQVVRDELTGVKIDEVTAKLQGLINYLSAEYQPKRERLDLTVTANRKELYDGLEKWSQELYDAKAILSYARFAERGLKSYMTAAMLHLMIFQEKALVDPHTLDPNQSSYLTTLRREAKKFSDHVDATFRRRQKSRLSAITLNRTEFGYIANHQYFHRKLVEFEDTVAGIHKDETDDKNGANYAKLKKLYHQHVKKVTKELEDGAGDPLGVFVPGVEPLAKDSYRIPVDGVG